MTMMASSSEACLRSCGLGTLAPAALPLVDRQTLHEARLRGAASDVEFISIGAHGARRGVGI